MVKRSKHISRPEAVGMEPTTQSVPHQRHRLIVGIDYGTTYSGVSFVTTDKSSIDDIHVVSSWPSQDAQSLWKVPTRIAYANENERRRLRADAWGCSVRPDMVSCSWTKLLLDNQATSSEHDDPYLRYAIEEGLLHIPKGKTPQEVCADFLGKLYHHVLEKIAAQIGEEFLNSTPIDCWVTVPAVWSDRASDMTVDAAKAAGFGCRPGDNVYMITEPEAAAIATFKTRTKPHAPNPPEAGENILVCDAGGGTVDISTYTIVATEPSLIFDEICVGVGGKCGSTFVDRNLHQLMVNRFGDNFASIEMRRKGPGSTFMESWERAKRSYRHGENNVNVDDVELGPLKIEGDHPPEFYDDDDGTIFLSSADMEGLFKPVVEQILKLIGDQVERVSHQGLRIKRLILVGGFADSHYLMQSVRAWGLRNGDIRVLCAAHPQAAIVQGAALRGLEGTAPRKKRMRRHYGFRLAMPFREGIDPENRAVYNRVDGIKRCQHRVDWMISKGTAIKGKASRRQTLYIDRAKGENMTLEIKLLSCSLDVPPDYGDSDRVDIVGTIKVDFTGVSKSKFSSRRTGNGIASSVLGTKHWNFEFELEVSFGAAQSNLTFRTLVEGVAQGSAHIDFD
ncbi:Hsp70 family protein [Zymoseptoria brevis]|uniref:Hsp70 family protein n=1 Tax=Zymoseptoria brevis TaxID=1047168 RepID=A0A0F4GES3_9PEZI|nr:Hsp70 family protein [Zymoseptoria brevis]